MSFNALPKDVVKHNGSKKGWFVLEDWVNDWLVKIGVIAGNPCCDTPSDSLAIVTTASIATTPVLRSNYNVILTAPASSKTRLPVAYPGLTVLIKNTGASTTAVTPYDTTSTIDATTSVNLVTLHLGIYSVNAAGNWITIYDVAY